MALVDTAVRTLHLLFGGLWAGSVVLVAVGAAPALDDVRSLAAVADRTVMLSRGSALVTFLTGGHMAGTAYTFGTLTGSGRGHLVLTMLALWVALTGLVEVGTSRLRDGDRKAGVRFYQFGSVAAVALLLVAGLLASA